MAATTATGKSKTKRSYNSATRMYTDPNGRLRLTLKAKGRERVNALVNDGGGDRTRRKGGKEAQRERERGPTAYSTQRGMYVCMYVCIFAHHLACKALA